MGGGPTGAAVLIDGREIDLDERQPFVFGRAEADDIVGLDATDMGISASAGSVEFEWDLWWVVNRSTKRRLLIEAAPGTRPVELAPGQRQVLSSARTTVLVPGAIYTHRVEVCLPVAAVAALRVQTAGGGDTITAGDVTLSERDRQAVVALFAGYLRAFPRHDPHPVSYQQAAEVLGPPWTRTTVRKQIERLKARLARAGVYVDGVHSNEQLADHLLSVGLLSPVDLDVLAEAGGP